MRDLRNGGPQEAQQAQLAAAIDHQRQQRSGNSNDGDNYGDHLQRVGDGEGAIEDLYRLGSQTAIGEDQQVMPAPPPFRPLLSPVPR